MRALPFLFLSLALPACAAEYVSELKGEPVPEPAYLVFELEPAPREVAAALPAPPSAEDRLFVGSFRLTPGHPELRVVLVEPAQGEPWLYADEDLDGRLSAGERFLPGEAGEVLLKLPPLRPGRPRHPVRLRSSPVRPGEVGIRRMLRSRGANVEGMVQIGLMEMLVRYPVDPTTGQVNLKGRIGMDLDEDGVIEQALSAGEVKMDVGDGPPIFRHWDSYLSTASFDLDTGRLVVKTHPASDYKQFDLRPGAELPDFAFTDLGGRRRRFSELRGKVVLLDFWSTTCGPCIMEMPALRKVQQDLGGRGFVILGMDFDDDLETHRKSVAELDLPWLHATSASVQDVILKKFGVTTFPTHILVDREGLVVSVGDPGQPPLKKDQLAATVEEVVSRKPVVEYAGRLDAEPVPRGGSGAPVKLEPASPELLVALPVRSSAWGTSTCPPGASTPRPGGLVLRTHSPSEYRRFNLDPGCQVPDFEYTDLEGKTRRLSELRGKVVLLDFWGAWCSSCVEELPGLQKAYEAYRGRGLEILGMDRADKLGDQKKMVAEKGLPWLHATAASVDDVISHGFGVWRFPTKILLDREGRVLAVVDEVQTEEELRKMLEAALQPSPTSSR